MKFFINIFIVVLFLIFSCKKENEIDNRENEIDYIDKVTGTYICKVYYSWSENLGSGPRHDSIYYDTILVKKVIGFKKISVGFHKDLDFNLIDSSFWGYHCQGKFYNDSIWFNYYATPIAIYNWDYYGVKVKL